MIRRVTLVSPYALGIYGGVQEQVLAMSRALSSRAIEVQIVAPDARDTRTYDTPAHVIQCGRLLSVPANGSRAPLALSARAAVLAARHVESFAPDVVHLHEPFAPRLGWRLLRTHPFATVATFHRAGLGPAVTWSKPLVRSLRGGIDVACAVSESARDTAKLGYGIDADVLFNGFEMSRFRAFDREPTSDVTILYVGRLEERKGVNVAIEAVRSHNDESDTPWRLVVVGDGPQRERLRALAANDPSIEFLGAVDEETKRRWYRRCHVVVAPSLHGESFGLVVLEAMASEVPVVLSDIDGYRQAAGGHGVLFQSGDVRDLQRALTVALHDDDAARTGALQHASKWSMQALVEEYLVRYERAIRLQRPVN